MKIKQSKFHKKSLFAYSVLNGLKKTLSCIKSKQFIVD